MHWEANKQGPAEPAPNMQETPLSAGEEQGWGDTCSSENLSGSRPFLPSFWVLEFQQFLPCPNLATSSPASWILLRPPSKAVSILACCYGKNGNIPCELQSADVRAYTASVSQSCRKLFADRFHSHRSHGTRRGCLRFLGWWLHLPCWPNGRRGSRFKGHL